MLRGILVTLPMPDFAAILAAVERCTPARASPRASVASFGAGLGAAAGNPAASVRGASCAYAEHAAPRADAPHPPDVVALRRAIARAGRDMKALRALRRLAARALHPDRGGDGAALAECNALIDAALRTARNEI